MNKPLFYELLAKCMTRPLSVEESIALREQVQLANYRDLQELDADQLMAIRHLHPSWSPEKEAQLQSEAKLRTRISRLRLATRWLGVAAVAGAVTFGWWWFNNKKIEEVYKTGAGVRKEMVLPDGSKVKLNANSTLVLAAGFDKKNRSVVLDGEGYFEVAPDSELPFIVRTTGMEITDAGAVFNVKAYKQEADEAVLPVKGKITVMPIIQVKATPVYTLEPQQKLVMHKNVAPQTAEAGRLTSGIVSIDTLRPFAANETIYETAWVKDELVFNNISLQEAGTLLRNWYGVDVVFENQQLPEALLSGHYRQLPLAALLHVWHEAVPDFHYKIEGKKVIVR
ncbi:ferric-dicitrate binding protein FerR (iron transport regulator) [Filimonas zeae]|nr:FecR family protein [Filimonas zeae]MDR6338045.1 ferric-dicitrate binding protein FerR (iron transport regulator) [Filimonas zeae]